MCVNILTFPQWEKTFIAEGQPRTGRERKMCGVGLRRVCGGKSVGELSVWVLVYLFILFIIIIIIIIIVVVGSGSKALTTHPNLAPSEKKC
jgi:hypothetical protein